MPKKKDAAAVALGRRGGKASASKLTDEQRREKARRAARAKWSKDKAQTAPRFLVRAQSRENAGTLTEREHEVAQYAARGRSNTEIARRLRIGVNTVKKHIGRAFEKLGVTNRTELAVLLMENRDDVRKRTPQFNAYSMGSVMLEAAKEAYDMAQYLARRGKPSSAVERNKPNALTQRGSGIPYGK